MTDTEASQLVRAAASVIADAVNDAIFMDPHQWSARPCPTCRVISAMTRKPFGCDRYRLALDIQQDSNTALIGDCPKGEK